LLRRGAIVAYETLTGRHVMPKLNELRRTQWWSRDQLLELQRRKLHRLLAYAYQYVPYYRRTFDAVGFKPDDFLREPASFQKLPLISKSVVNEHFDQLLTTDPARQRGLIKSSTSGSTGQPLVFMQDHNYRDYVTADYHRHMEWSGWKFGEKHAYIWGADFELASQHKLRTRLMDWALNRFLTNAYTLSEESMLAFAEQVRRERPKLLFGYASALDRFAKFVQERGLDDIKFQGIVSSAEVLFPIQREVIEATFGCRILDRYATRELGGIACGCVENAGSHISIENCMLEVLRDGQPAPAGEEGEIVVTNFNNYGMPLIRYRSGDMGRLSSAACRCGRGLPLMDVVQGRLTDLFKTRQGRIIYGGYFRKLFYGITEVEQFQVIQKSYDHIVVNIVAQSPVPAERLSFIEDSIQEVMQSEIKVEFQFKDVIPLKSSGKYRFTISEVQ
jgi:phenylacetate-CoA ligase